MARGKIRIKRIENPTNRQIVYCKRRNVLFKMARDLDSLSDDTISIIMISDNGRLHEYLSSSTTTKEVIDLYQKTRGIDIWSPQYERMEERLKELKETNMSLRKQISQMKGEGLSDLSFEELFTLDREMEAALETLRSCKFFKMRCQLDFVMKKIQMLKAINEQTLIDFGVMDDPDHGVVDNGGVYDYGLLHAFASGLQLNQPTDTETKSVLTSCSISTCSVNQPNFDDEGESVHTTTSNSNSMSRSLKIPDSCFL